MKRKIWALLSLLVFFVPNMALAGQPQIGGLGASNQIQKVVQTKPPKVPICHVTASKTNRYVFERVDASAVDGQGKNDHTKHQRDGFKDIIPITDLTKDGKVDQADCDKAGEKEECEIKAPKLLAPLNGAVDVSLDAKLTWKKVAGAEYYVVQVSKKSNFNVVKEFQTTQTTLTLNDLAYGKTYYWRVRAVDTDVKDCISVWAMASFTTKEKSVEEKLSICHVTDSEKNRYELIEIAESAIEAHKLHEADGFKDIIPAVDTDKDGKLTVEDCYGKGGGEEEPDEDDENGRGGGIALSPVVPSAGVTEIAEGFGGGGTLPEAGVDPWVLSSFGAGFLTLLKRLKDKKK